MAFAYILSPAAQNDLETVAEDLIDRWKDFDAAEAYIERLYREFEKLADNHGIGHRREDLTALPVFFWNALDRFAVIYRKRQPIEIVRVLPWRMNIPALLDQSSGFYS